MHRVDKLALGILGPIVLAWGIDELVELRYGSWRDAGTAIECDFRGMDRIYGDLSYIELLTMPSQGTLDQNPIVSIEREANETISSSLLTPNGEVPYTGITDIVFAQGRNQSGKKVYTVHYVTAEQTATQMFEGVFEKWHTQGDCYAQHRIAERLTFREPVERRPPENRTF